MSTSDEFTTRGERSRDAVLDAAAALMAERGYAGASISAICTQSGLPPSSVYWHFGSKDGVLKAVLDRSARRHLDDFGTPDTAGANRDERLTKLLSAMAAFVELASPNLRFLMVLGLREGRATELTVQVLLEVRGQIRTWLRGELIDILGLDDNEDLADELATLVISVANGIQLAGWVEGQESAFPVDSVKVALTAIADART